MLSFAKVRITNINMSKRKESCCIGSCNNKSWLSDKLCVRGHVENLKFHAFPKDSNKFHQWENAVAKGRVGYKICKSRRVCSNHFTDGKPTFQNPYPTLYLTPSESAEKRTEFNRSPKKRRKLERQTSETPKSIKKSMSLSASESPKKSKSTGQNLD